jgi:hypothetical protein
VGFEVPQGIHPLPVDGWPQPRRLRRFPPARRRRRSRNRLRWGRLLALGLVVLALAGLLAGWKIWRPASLDPLSRYLPQGSPLWLEGEAGAVAALLDRLPAVREALVSRLGLLPGGLAPGSRLLVAVGPSFSLQGQACRRQLALWATRIEGSWSPQEGYPLHPRLPAALSYRVEKGEFRLACDDPRHPLVYSSSEGFSDEPEAPLPLLAAVERGPGRVQVQATEAALARAEGPALPGLKPGQLRFGLAEAAGPLLPFELAPLVEGLRLRGTADGGGRLRLRLEGPAGPLPPSRLRLQELPAGAALALAVDAELWHRLPPLRRLLADMRGPEARTPLPPLVEGLASGMALEPAHWRQDLRRAAADRWTLAVLKADPHASGGGARLPLGELPGPAAGAGWLTLREGAWCRRVDWAAGIDGQGPWIEVQLQPWRPAPAQPGPPTLEAPSS